MIAQIGDAVQNARIFRFTAEGEYIAPQTAQHAHAAARECVRRAHDKQRGQFKYRVRAAAQRRLYARRFIYARGFAPLGKAAAHADDHIIAARDFPRFVDVIRMPRMKRIVFGDDSGDFHVHHSHNASIVA